MILCHPELVSGSHNFSNKKFTYPSYCANKVRCGIFYFLFHHSFSFLRRKEKERLQEKETRKSKTTTKFNPKRVNSFHSDSTRFVVVSLSGCKWCVDNSLKLLLNLPSYRTCCGIFKDIVKDAVINTAWRIIQYYVILNFLTKRTSEILSLVSLSPVWQNFTIFPIK